MQDRSPLSQRRLLQRTAGPYKGVIQVPVTTLDDIRVEGGAPQPLDFLSVDVEGHEIEVLRAFNFARWQPRLILSQTSAGKSYRSSYGIVNSSFCAAL